MKCGVHSCLRIALFEIEDVHHDSATLAKMPACREHVGPLLAHGVGYVVPEHDERWVVRKLDVS